jgi:hypothetical protein
MSERTIGQEIGGFEDVASQGYYDIPEVQEKKGIDVSILKAKTGEGSVYEYINHPLNFNESLGLARVLRGLTGMLGTVDFAIADIVIGALDFLKSSKKGIKENAYNDTVGGLS